jgi:hypothetical protein
MIEYRFRVPSAAVFTLYSYSKDLEYRFRVPTAGSLILQYCVTVENRWKFSFQMDWCYQIVMDIGKAMRSDM